MRRTLFLVIVALALAPASKEAAAQYISPVFWQQQASSGDPCAGSPGVGDTCADGSVYAGLSPDGASPMCAARCDYGMSWNGTSCTGTRGTRTWASGTPFDIVADVNCYPASACQATGRADSAAIVAQTSGSHGGPHQAAEYCEDLSEDGHTAFKSSTTRQGHMPCDVFADYRFSIFEVRTYA
jgi:hypothetical protein